MAEAHLMHGIERIDLSVKFPPLATHCVNYLYRLPRLK